MSAFQMADVNALNRDFTRYDQVEKSHTYRLAEHPSDASDDDYEIATLDLGRFLNGNSTDKNRFIEEFGAAVQDIGFSVLTGHGVDTKRYDKMHDLVIELFESLSIREAPANFTAMTMRSSHDPRRDLTSTP